MDFKFLNSNTGKIIISIIWGFGLSALFRRACKGRNCIIIRGINPSQIKDKTFQFDDKCYKYDTINVSCSNTNDILLE